MPQKGILLFPGGTATHNGCTCGTTQVPALEHVANRPIAHHVLDAMGAAGIDEVIVAGSADVLIDVRTCLRRYEREGLRVEYAMSRRSSDPTAALQAAAPMVGAAPCIVHVGDGLLDEPLRCYVEVLQQRALDLVLVRRDPSAWKGSDSALSHNGVAFAGGKSTDAEAGLGVFGPGAFEKLAALRLTRGDRGSNALHSTCHPREGKSKFVWRPDGGDIAAARGTCWSSTGSRWTC